MDATGIGPWSRGSAVAYPWANVAHVLGAIALVGAIGVVDLRLMGLWRALPAEPLKRALVPVAIGGFAVMLASGTVLLAADGPALSKSGLFQAKLVLIALAGANALAFRWRQAGWLAAMSLGLWVAVVVAGRMIAYS
ncbi:hypothetical protein COC42_10680 [Sphingomonas spermidinifaciens]|uniref:Uncharacterized protein n=1 Tax=Sphingomonas spermidinifaciens TaxID=1141889 RepID=A0A2A4B2U3_9SPHN|nr:hypothetical protein COC42_10680 [Sphingomonas spermidinifaciens]